MEDLGLLIIAGFFAGFVDAIAGGGGLISLPTLLMYGLSPVEALATNKLQSSFGTASAVTTYSRQGLIDLRAVLLSVTFTFFGALFGTGLAQVLKTQLLIQIIPFLLLATGGYFLLRPHIDHLVSKKRLSVSWFSVLFGILLGFYDGFFGPGTGAFWNLALVTFAGYSLLHATAYTKVVNFTSNVASLLLFAIGGHVVWQVGISMASGQLLGAYLGSKTVIRFGARMIRPVLVMVCLFMALKLMTSTPDHIITRGVKQALRLLY